MFSAQGILRSFIIRGSIMRSLMIFALVAFVGCTKSEDAPKVGAPEPVQTETVPPAQNESPAPAEPTVSASTTTTREFVLEGIPVTIEVPSSQEMTENDSYVTFAPKDYSNTLRFSKSTASDSELKSFRKGLSGFGYAAKEGTVRVLRDEELLVKVTYIPQFGSTEPEFAFRMHYLVQNPAGTPYYLRAGATSPNEAKIDEMIEWCKTVKLKQ